MQNLERYFGIRIDLVDQIDPQKITRLTAEARAILAALELDPAECHLYFHELRVVPVRHHFSHPLSVAQRIDILCLTFRRNPKQTSDDLRFLNRHMNRHALEVAGVEPRERDHELRYEIGGDYIERNRSFYTDLVTYVRASLRKDRRKIKAIVKVSPTTAYDSLLRINVPILTKVDLRYSRFTQLNRPPIRTDREKSYNRWFDETPSNSPGTAFVTGPPFLWRGPSDDVTLHSLFRTTSNDMQEIGDLEKACERAKSVCRVEDINGVHLGTGVLIAHGLVLTNFHVVFEVTLQPNGDSTWTPTDIDGQLQFRFGCVSQEDGTISQGRVIAGADRGALVASSETLKLDFALIRLAGTASETAGVPLDSRLPRKSSALHIIQHPGHSTGSMKLVRGANAVTSTLEGVGRFQYVTLASGGSSGAPCFTAGWRMIGLHHAEVASGLFVRREGILMRAILPQIREHLT